MKTLLRLTVPLSTTNVTGAAQVACFEFEGTPAEISLGITEMFDAGRADSLHQELELKVTSTSAVSGHQ